MYNRRFQPFRDDHTDYHARLRYEVNSAEPDQDRLYAAIASQLIKTNYDDFFIDY